MGTLFSLHLSLLPQETDATALISLIKGHFCWKSDGTQVKKERKSVPMMSGMSETENSLILYLRVLCPFPLTSTISCNGPLVLNGNIRPQWYNVHSGNKN